MKILIVLSTLLAFAAAWPSFETREQFIQDVLNSAKMNMEETDPSESPQDAIQEYNGNQEIESAIDQLATGQVFGIQRVYTLDMTDHFQQCPSNLKLYSYGPRRFCGRKTNGNGCDSVMIPVGGQPYTEVHGKVVAYQYASPDAFHVGGNPGIDGAYVDGISITYGQSPRRHIWTLAAGLHSYKKYSTYTCPGTGYGVPQPEFVANNYFCSSSNFDSTKWERRFYDIPLWSTVTGDCGCSAYDVPYFCAKLPEATTEDLELRICANQELADEDIKIESITIYVR